MDEERRGCADQRINQTRSQKNIFGRYNNTWNRWSFSLTAAMDWFFKRNNSSVTISEQELQRELNVLDPFFVTSPSSVGTLENGLRVTWLGHATVLVEMDGLVILTDPVFSEKVGIHRRYRPSPCSVAQLPRLDVVLISHTHYDHLNAFSVNELNCRFGAALRWLVPQGLQDWMRRSGCQNVTQLDWWEKTCIPGHNEVTFVFTPAQHWSARTPFDVNVVLWGSWSVLGPSQRFFFAGDTGYCDAFKEIGKSYGPFDLAAIPIGAYEPRSFLRFQHVDPEEAVQIHIDVRARHSLGIHWGTFVLSKEHYLEPRQRLSQAIQQQRDDPNEFFTLNHGESWSSLNPVRANMDQEQR